MHSFQRSYSLEFPSKASLLMFCSSLLALGISGCRFGNYVERADTSAATDPITGYYAAQPTSLVFCAEKAVGSNTTTDCEEANTTEIPSDIRATMTNPVVLYLADSDGSGLILPNDGSDYGISTQFKSLSEIESVAQSEQSTLWLDASCKRTAFFQQVGTFAKNSSTLALDDPGSLSLTLTYYEVFDGDCEQTFSQIYACMNDATQCAEDPLNPTESTQELLQLQSGAENFLTPYLNAGVLSTGEFAQLRSFAFEVVYQ